jgi:hypothetical protein
MRAHGAFEMDDCVMHAFATLRQLSARAQQVSLGQQVYCGSEQLHKCMLPDHSVKVSAPPSFDQNSAIVRPFMDMAHNACMAVGDVARRMRAMDAATAISQGIG